MEGLPPDPSLSPQDREKWIEAQKKLKLANTPPFKTVTQTSAGKSFGNQKRVVEETSVKFPKK
ncbi:MAG: hypothetical protein QY322_04460 [bacterium]|nr:MAG: hypothetical protein QY322_04460 [bacterium]